MMFILQVLEYTVYCFFGATVAYAVFFSVAGHLKKVRKQREVDHLHRIAILIPAYKEDSVIVGAAQSMLRLDYPKDLFEVFVIADQLKPATLVSLKQLNIHVVEVVFEKSTKTKSLNHCLNQMDRNSFEIVVVSDADNILEESFLRHINGAYAHGYRAIQGRRVAKNADTNLAVLDGASEAINNHIFRQGPRNLGLSASLIGSAMAFSMKEFYEVMSSVQAVGGFDKVLQLGMIERGNTIHYVPEAIAYDEKVSTHSNFQNQRKRWLYSQYRYLAQYFRKGIAMLFKGNLSYFNIAILHSLFLPRVLNIGLLPTFFIISLIFSKVLLIQPLAWAILLAGYFLALALALPKQYYSWRVARALRDLPKGFWGMFKLLFKLKGADKQFIHTAHNQDTIDNGILPPHGKG